MKKLVCACVVLSVAFLAARPLDAHCEIPCGIYNDALRADLIAEHIATIEKSMAQIAELAAAPAKNYNQIVRWVHNKEAHATELQHIVTQYFLTQRVKPVAPGDKAKHAKYVAQLELLHGMLVAAMKAKQTTDLAHVKTLRELLSAFRASYFGPQAHRHLREHHHPVAAGRH